MPAKAIEMRLKELESSAQQARMEAMRIGALLLAKNGARLVNAGVEPEQTGELATLKAHYEMLTLRANDAQAALDKLQAELHDLKYYR
jgi:hypothetical protein